jgi:hypothetical protein
VGDDEGRAALGRGVQGLLDLGFGDRVQRAGRLVQDQDRRVLENGAGDRQALTLPARQKLAAFADDEIQAAFLLLHELPGLRRSQGGLKLLVGGVRPGHAQVVGDRAVEQARILEDDGDRLAQRGQGWYGGCPGRRP